jgi:hypothetical protein
MVAKFFFRDEEPLQKVSQCCGATVGHPWHTVAHAAARLVQTAGLKVKGKAVSKSTDARAT